VICHIDVETYSVLDVSDVGAYRYAEDPSTEVLICCYAFDDGPVQTWLPFKMRPLPGALAAHARRGGVFVAHNAQFERAIWQYVLVERHGAPPTKPAQWHCTAVLAAQAGLPRSLDNATTAAQVDHKKNPDGKKLIRVFCMPRRPTKSDPSTRVLPRDRPEDFRRFMAYCADDVRAERALHQRLPPLPDRLQKQFTFDMIVNERGLPFDLPLVSKALPIVEELGAWASERALALTDGIKPTQVAKLKDWINDQLPSTLYLPNLQKTTIERAAIHPDCPDTVREALEIRMEAGLVSHKKFYAMQRVCSPRDHRARGTILFYGAHTGRKSGKLIQPHNFKRGVLKPHQIAHVFTALGHGDADFMLRLWPNPMEAISMVMRGFICALPGRILRVVDYSAIEARVLAWLAGETWLINAFLRGIDIYKLMACKLWHIALEEVSSEQRRIAKNLVLGCGYQLGGKKFVEYCARAGVYIEEPFAIEAVGTYRSENKMIVRAWYDVENAAIAAVQTGQVVRWRMLEFEVQDRWLTIRLPSGRRLYYMDPKVVTAMAFGKPKLQLTFKEDYRGQMLRTSTYGGKLVENIVQGIAFDLMAHGEQQADSEGYESIGTVHDEVITETPEDEGDIHELEQIVCRIPPWAKGCPVGAEGFDTVRYRKN
jgi:DNA polymerase bacteriophage-type